jgi:sporulation protein YlmC with PRC-barrel domain
MKASKLTGMPVISIAEGVKAGQVTDLTLMATSPRVTSLALRAGREQTTLPFDAIRQIGPDAIMIEKLDVVHGEEPPVGGDETRRFTTIRGKETAGDDGRYLGDLTDLEIDPSSGRIDAICLQLGGMLGIGVQRITVPGEHLHAFGPKLITVVAPVADREDPGAVEHPSGDTGLAMSARN